MRAALVSLLLMVAASRTAAAEVPPQRFGFAVALDGHLGFGDTDEASLAARGEVIFMEHSALVVRVGAGSARFSDAESYDPTFSLRFARLGFRLVATRIYLGIELGRTWSQAHWEAMNSTPAHDGARTGQNTVTAMLGWQLGPVDLGFDYTDGDFANFGVYFGAGYRTP